MVDMAQLSFNYENAPGKQARQGAKLHDILMASVPTVPTVGHFLR
jgi:hypothetical protein